MSSVMVVDAESLAGAPLCFRDYVAEYFTESEMLGRRIFYSGRTCLMPDQPYPLSDKAKRGTAPSHSVELMRFEGLSEWLRENKDSGIFYEFYAPPAPSCGLGYDDL